MYNFISGPLEHHKTNKMTCVRSSGSASTRIYQSYQNLTCPQTHLFSVTYPSSLFMCLLQILYPDKLIVNGKLVRNEFPDWGEVLHRSRTTELLILTNVISESSLGTRDSLNINQERVDVAESIISDRSSYAHGIDEDMETCETQTSCDPLIAELNVDLPSESDASVIIHKAEILPRTVYIQFRPIKRFFDLIIWMTQLQRYKFMNLKNFVFHMNACLDQSSVAIDVNPYYRSRNLA